jgi:Holliday junction DNA helicase RuvB
VLQRAGDLAAILTNLQPRDVLFVDEIHRLQPAIEETLYPRWRTSSSTSSSARDRRPAPSASTCPRSPSSARPPGRGSSRRRSATASASRCASSSTRRRSWRGSSSAARQKLGFALTGDGAREIATRARGTPRIAGRLLRRIRDFAAVAEKTADRRLVDAPWCGLEVDSLGLDAMDRRYLRRLADHHGGGPVGVETLAAGPRREPRHAGGGDRALPHPGGTDPPHPARPGPRLPGWKHLGMTPPRNALVSQGDLLDDPTA